MQISEFKGFLTDICRYYERKQPNGDTADIWFNRVKLISYDALPIIRARIQEDCESFPRNLPKLMWEYNQEYRKSEGKQEVRAYKACSQCNGEGDLFLQKKQVGGYYTRYVFRCDQCKQSHYNGIPWGNREYLIYKENYEDIPETEGSEKITNIHELQEFLIDFAELPF